MVALGNTGLAEVIEGFDLPNIFGLVVSRQVQHLVKISIVKCTIPPDGNQFTAHELIDRVWIKMFDQ